MKGDEISESNIEEELLEDFLTEVFRTKNIFILEKENSIHLNARIFFDFLNDNLSDRKLLITYDGHQASNLNAISYHGINLPFSRPQESVPSFYYRFMESRMVLKSTSGHVYKFFPSYSYPGGLLNVENKIKLLPVFLDRSDRIKNVRSTIKVPLMFKVDLVFC